MIKIPIKMFGMDLVRLELVIGLMGKAILLIHLMVFGFHQIKKYIQQQSLDTSLLMLFYINLLTTVILFWHMVVKNGPILENLVVENGLKLMEMNMSLLTIMATGEDMMVKYIPRIHKDIGLLQMVLFGKVLHLFLLRNTLIKS